MHRNGQLEAARDLAKEDAFALIGLDQMDPPHAHRGQHEAGKSAPRSEVEKATGGPGEVPGELGGIEHMTAPEVCHTSV